MCEQSDESRDLMLEVAGPLKEERPAQSSPTILEHLLCKNRLQEYTQRSGIPLPIYQTVNEGVQHAPRFRSTVFVDGVYFTSPNTFTNRKAAERDVATLALDGITQKIKEEGYPLICQDTIFCKSILNEYAVKMSLERPTFKTIQPEGLLPVFVSSLVFNGVTYTGEAGTNKKEAEQLAARAVILSILGNSESGTVIFEIIKSKFRLYAALHKVKDFNNTQNGFMPSSVNTGPSSCFMPLAVNTGTSSGFPISKGKEVEVSGGPNDMTNTTIPETYQLTNIPAMHQQPFHEFKKPKWEPSTTAFTPIVFVPPAMEQPLGAGPSSAKKRNRKNKKKSKKIQVDDQFRVSVLPRIKPIVVQWSDAVAVLVCSCSLKPSLFVGLFPVKDA